MLAPKKFIFAILLSSVLFSFQVFALNNQADTDIIPGWYGKNLDRYLLLQHDQDTNAWSSIETIADMPANIYSSHLHRGTCQQGICVAVGHYTTGEINLFSEPLIVLSKNNGKDWKFVNILNLPDNIKGNLYSLSCTDNLCIAVGNYQLREAANPTIKPLIISSKDNGETWSFGQNIINPSEHPEYYQYTELYSVNCSDKTCIAGGNNAMTNIPFLLVSHDQGKNWSIVTDIKNAKQHNFITVTNIKCVKKFCIASGNTYNSIALLTSQNNGDSWEYVNDIANAPTDMSFPQIKSISCHSLSCVLVGYYQSISFKPFIITSNDLGKSWSYNSNIINLPSNDRSNLNSVWCNDMTCLAVGSYAIRSMISPAEKDYPLMLLSMDAGTSWSFVKLLDLPKYKQMWLSTVLCNDNDCIAYGVYDDVNNQILPLILSSHDKGLTWSSVKTIANLPEDMTYINLSEDASLVT